MPDEEKRYELIVNAKPKGWREDTISYNQVVELAYPPPYKPNEVFTVQYSRGPEGHQQGTLANGQTVPVKSGMNFDVTRTDKS